MHCTHKNAVIRGQSEGGRIRRNFVKIIAVAHKKDFYPDTGYLAHIDCVKNYAQSLIPHHASDEKQIEAVIVKRIFAAYRRDFTFIGSSLRKVDTVFHHGIFALITEAPQIVARTLAYDPDIVAGVYVVNHNLESRFVKQLVLNHLTEVNIEFSVVCKHHRHIELLFEAAPQHRRSYRAMSVNYIDITFYERFGGATVKRISDSVRLHLFNVKAAVAKHLKRIIILRIGIFRHDDICVAVFFIYDRGIIEHGICDTVNSWRK